MILAAGLTPAWQYVLIFDELKTGAVNRARESRWFASGKAVNAALAAHSLGHRSVLVSLTGGQSGHSLSEDFEATGAEAEWVTSGTPTRVCTTLINLAKNETTELVENSAGVTTQELARYQKAFVRRASEASVIALCGSLPNNTPRSLYHEMLEASAANSPALQRTGNGPARLVLDIRGPELTMCLPHRPFLVKPNREELAATVGRSLESDADLLASMHWMNQQGAEWVLVTNGGRPAWVTHQGQVWQVTPPQGVPVVNPIGCGDSVAAGVSAGLAEGLEPLKCIALGLGAASANLEMMECARFDNQRARMWAETVVVERLNEGA